MTDVRKEQGDEPVAGHGLPLLYNLAYCSRAADGVDDATVAAIVASAQRHNPRTGITGLLVFGSGIFFQWLEGPREHVAALMDALMTDPRHDTIVRLSESEDVRERMFPDWAMELVTAADIRDVLDDALSDAQDESDAAALRLLLGHLDHGRLQGIRGS